MSDAAMLVTMRLTIIRSGYRDLGKPTTTKALVHTFLSEAASITIYPTEDTAVPANPRS
jgi:hypothetical protein